MGRPKKEEKDKKVKVGISMDRTLYLELMKNGGKLSQIVEKIIKEYYGNKNL
jgi:ribosomal protein S16